MKVIVGGFYDTDRAKMTLFIQKHKDSFTKEIWEWIEAEVDSVPFDEYIQETIRGCLMRACLVASKKNNMFSNNLMILKDGRDRV